LPVVDIPVLALQDPDQVVVAECIQDAIAVSPREAVVLRVEEEPVRAGEGSPLIRKPIYKF
jgi:hypothetical protein